MACGVPVVATRSSGTTDIVRHRVDGLLVDQHEPAAFAAALEEVVGDEAMRRRLSEEARIGANRFALPAIASVYDGVLRGALA
jgi:glycosyltransferase involved in cell wall biosynthesis